MDSLPDDVRSLIVQIVALRYNDLKAVSLTSHMWHEACMPILRQFMSLIPAQPSTKVALLGICASGRSTLLRHFIALHGPHRLQQELLPEIRTRAVQACAQLVDEIMARDQWDSACTQLGIDPSLSTTLEQLIDMCSAEGVCPHIDQAWPPSPKLFADVRVLWAKFQHSVRLPADAVNMLEQGLERFTATNFEPTLQDVLSFRLRTRGVSEHVFDLGGHSLRVTDLRNLRGRRRLFQIFENCDMVVFVVALDHYGEEEVDHYDGEEPWLLSESLYAWEKLCRLEFIDACTSFVLVLNRADLFRAKLCRVPFGAAWEAQRHADPWQGRMQSYVGDDADADAVIAFLRDRFVELAGGRRVATHVTCALDGESVSQLWPWGLLRNHAAHRAEFPRPRPRPHVPHAVHTTPRRRGPRLWTRPRPSTQASGPPKCNIL